MQKILVMAVLLLVTMKSYGAINWDGCYQTYRPGSMYPVICLDGTQEEGLSGAGARMVSFGTNSDTIKACGVSSSLNMSANSLEFIINPQMSLLLSNAQPNGEILEGDFTIGNATLKFMKLSDGTAARLTAKLYAEPKCAGLAAGSFIRLNVE